MSTKEHARELLEQLAPKQLASVVRLLESLTSSEAEGSNVSEVERKALAEADQWLQKNAPIPNEDILAEFGLTEADWEKMGQESEAQLG